MTKLRKQLDQIDAWLCAEGGADLADVLSALRGPEGDDRALKARTTIWIRRTAFPCLAEQPMQTLKMETSVPFVFPMGPSHFDHHIRQAAIALEFEGGEEP